MFDLQRFRKEKKLLQKSIANKIGIDQSRLSKYESGPPYQTDYISDLLIESYPEIIKYLIIDKIEEPNVDYSAKDDIIKNLERIIASKDETIKALNKQNEILQSLSDYIPTKEERDELRNMKN